MAKKIKAIAPFLFFFPLFLSAQWQKQVLPLEPFEDLYGISFLSDDEYFICSNSEISHTLNAGGNWQVKNLLEGAPFLPFLTNTLYDLHFYNSNSGIATGAFNLLNNELVIRSDDGNQSWNMVYVNEFAQPPVFFNNLDVRGQNVLACGHQGHIIRSTDAGTSFSEAAAFTNLSLTDILYLDDNHAIALDATQVLRSNNGGATWLIDPVFAGKGACCLARADANTLYMVSEGRLLRSTDNGQSFSLASSIPTPGGLGVLAASHDTLLTANTYGICISTNGGQSWQQFKETRDVPVNRLAIRSGKAYALCDAAALYTLDLSAMAPQPIAYFGTDIQADCGKTTLTLTAAADTSKLDLQWFLNDLPIGNDPLYTQTYSNYVFENQNFTLVVSDKLSQQTDTLRETPNIPYLELATLGIGPDQYLCYGSRALLVPEGVYYQYEWQNYDVIDPEYHWILQFIPGEATYPLTQDTQIVLKSWIYPQCPTYDTLRVYVGESYSETFHYTDPKIPNSCSNASCSFIPDLQFVSETVGYGISSNGIFLKTVDAGKTWIQKDLNSTLSSSFPRGSLDFVDELTGYTTCPNQKTTDGGETFVSIPAPADPYGYTDFVDYIDADTGVYVVSDAFSPGFSSVYKTTDGGQTFQKILTCYFRINDVSYFDHNTIYVAGGYTQGWFFRSSDGGLTWDTLGMPEQLPYIWSMDILSKDTLFLQNNDFIHRTYDGGQTWFSYFLPFGAGKVKMLNSQVGYASGYENQLFKTVNGGECWTQVFTAEYPNIDFITIPPSGTSVYFTANDSHSANKGPVVYHTRFYHEFGGEVPSVTCVGTPLRTRNKCFGYTHYQWYLDGMPYGTSYDVEHKFDAPGDYLFKMVADSAGWFKDSAEWMVHVKEAPGSIGAIEGPRELCGMQTILLGYYLPQNDHFVHYNWSNTFYPYMSSSAGSPNHDRYFEFYAYAGSGSVGLQVYALDSLGCVSDTASADISILNTLPPNPAGLELSEYCHTISDADFVNGNSVDSIAFTATAAQDPVTYILIKEGQELGQFAEPEGVIPTYFYCTTGHSVFQLYQANVCGISSQFATDTLLNGFEHLSFAHSNDTVVQSGMLLNLYAKAIREPFLESICPPLIPEWFFDGQSMGQQPVNGFWVEPSLAGVWTAKFYNGCDTIALDMHVAVTSGVETPKQLDTSLLISPNPNDGAFFVHLSAPVSPGARLKLYAANGQLLRELPLSAGTANQAVDVRDLPSGLYWLRWVEEGVVKGVGRFVR